MLTYEGDISNYLGVNIKKNSDGIFELLQYHLVEKIINHIGLTVSASLKARATTTVKPLLNKYEYSLVSNCVLNYRTAVVMLSYLKVSTRP